MHILPNANPEESKKIELNYYKHLSEMILETLWCYTAKPEDIQPKVQFKNIEKFEEIYISGQNATIMITHIGNWELFCQWAPLFIPQLNVVILYTPIKNKVLNEFMLRLRQRFGSMLISTKSTFELFRIQKTKNPCINLFAIDQNPGDPYHQYWTELFGLCIPVISGAEKFAKSQNQSCYFLNVEKIDSIYHLELIDIKANAEDDHAIVHETVKLVETNILKNPALWLLSHNRFKYAKEII